jgi:hypothetical protein
MTPRCLTGLLGSMICLAPGLLPLRAATPRPTAGGPPVITGLDVTAGNLAGGTVVTLSVDNVSTEQGTVVTVGNVPATILQVVPGVSIRFVTPAVPEPSGGAVDVAVRSAGGKAVLAGAYTYTPTLSVSVIGSAAAGGGLLLTWQTEGLSPLATMTVWVGNPTLSDFVATLPGYAGLLYEEPGLEFVSTLATDGGFVLHFPALPAFIVGFPLHLQGLATKEGAHKGSFTNVATFAIP